MTQRTTLAAFRRSIPAFALSLALFACSNDKDNGNNEKIEGNSLLLNFTSDYTTGELRWMHPDSANLSEGTLSFNQDSKVSTAEGNIFILENNPGTLSCILPQSIGDTPKQERLSAEFPYGATVIGSKGYIALNDADYIQVFNVNTCTPSEKIDLPILEEEAPTNISTIKASGDTLLVTLQRLENWSATKPGLLVRINASTKTLIDTIQLKLYNPSSSILSKGKLYISLQGAYDPIDYSIDITKTGIEVVDLATGTSEILKTGTELGGGAGGIALDEANQILYITTVSADWVTSVKSINLASKTVESTLPDILNVSGGIVFDKAGKKLFIGDKDGLKVYDPVAKTTKTIGNQDSLLKPYSLAIVNF
ncbi:MAG: hypothetical protein LBC87_01295 [Fibromonadaceae bacterium]|jgi:DNA-binding beta-propeller fold protein YncE|nr:hypothetical protein [Fibromonadaceae bacterium]